MWLKYKPAGGATHTNRDQLNSHPCCNRSVNAPQVHFHENLHNNKLNDLMSTTTQYLMSHVCQDSTELLHTQNLTKWIQTSFPTTDKKRLVSFLCDEVVLVRNCHWTEADLLQVWTWTLNFEVFQEENCLSYTLILVSHFLHQLCMRPWNEDKKKILSSCLFIYYVKLHFVHTSHQLCQIWELIWVINLLYKLISTTFF